MQFNHLRIQVTFIMVNFEWNNLKEIATNYKNDKVILLQMN